MAEQKVTDTLMAEHRAIERMLQVVEGTAMRLQRGEDVPSRLFVDVATFLGTFVDRCHFAKEEKLLTLHLERRGLKSEGTLPVMLNEHKEAGPLAQQMRELGEAYAAGTLQDRQKLAGVTHTYAHLLRQHITREDKALHTIASNLLTPVDQQKLFEACDRIEREAMGEGEYERFLAMVDQLAGVAAP